MDIRDNLENSPILNILFLLHDKVCHYVRVNYTLKIKVKINNKIAIAEIRKPLSSLLERYKPYVDNKTGINIAIGFATVLAGLPSKPTCITSSSGNNAKVAAASTIVKKINVIYITFFFMLI